MKNKNKAGLLLLAATLGMVACNKKEPEPELGEIKVVENENNGIKKVVDEVAKTSMSVDTAMKDEKVPFYNSGTFNDGGFIDFDLSPGFLNENIKSLVTTPGIVMHKDLENNIYVDNMTDFNTITIAKNDDIYEPYKFGTPGVYVMSMNGAAANYKVYANGKTYEVKSDNELILADEENAYLLGGDKLYRYNYDSGIENEIEVTLKGAPVKIKAALDRYDNKTIMLHVNNDGYLVRLSDIQGNTLELQANSKVKVDDIEKILRGNFRNDCGRFLYKSTDGKLKVYDKMANKVTIELPDVTENLGIDVIDSSVYYGDIDKGEYVIFFTDGYKTYRYVSNSSTIYRVSQEPLETLGEHFQGMVVVRNNKMVYKFFTSSGYASEGCEDCMNPDHDHSDLDDPTELNSKNETNTEDKVIDGDEHKEESQENNEEKQLEENNEEESNQENTEETSEEKEAEETENNKESKDGE